MCESIESGSCVGCSDDRILPEPFGSCFDIVHGYIYRFVYILSLSRSRFLNSSSAAWYYVSRLSEWNTDVSTSGHQDFRQGLSTFDSVSFVTKIAQTFFPRLYLIMLCFKKQLSTTLKRKKIWFEFDHETEGEFTSGFLPEALITRITWKTVHRLYNLNLYQVTTK